MTWSFPESGYNWSMGWIWMSGMNGVTGLYNNHDPKPSRQGWKLELVVATSLPIIAYLDSNVDIRILGVLFTTDQ